MTEKVLVTGATGYIGSALVEMLGELGAREPVLALRREPTVTPAYRYSVTGDLAPDTDWREALTDCKFVVHSAARVHVMDEDASNPLAEYRRANVEGTLNLARQAAKAGVARFVFLSSIKVNGEQSLLDQPFTADDEPAPEDPYGISKYEAERGLLALAKESGMEVVIIRPPLVYGAGVKGNFASMTRLVEKGLPLPLGAIHNQRSLVALDNLVDLIITCIDHPSAANEVFLAGDGRDLSTTELLRGVGEAMGKPARLIPVPSGVLMAGATLLGKKAMAQRLLGSLQVDISKAQTVLGWQPPLTVEQGLKRCFEPGSEA